MKKIYLSAIFSFLLLIGFSNAADLDNDGIDDTEEQALGEKYAPILYFEKEEKLFPVAVEYHISNSNLNKSVNNTSILIDANPSVEELSIYNDMNENFYLDNRKGTIYNNGIIKDYEENLKSLGYTVYCHVFKENSSIVIQYWLFYAFNKGTLNTHEGDWEMVQVVLDGSNKPIKAMYSQHISGQKAKWEQVEKSEEHMKVYVARGSHANYFRYYQGLLGLAKDRVGKNGKILKPSDYNLVLLGEVGGENHAPEQNWLDFAGRWGDFGGKEDELRGKRGPFGPVYRENGEMWNGLEWENSLQALNDDVLKIEWLLYHFVTIYFIIFGISLAFILFMIFIRYKKKKIEKPFFHILEIKGMDMKSLGNVLAIAAIIIAIAALFYPWYGASVNIPEGEYKTSGYVNVITIDGLEGIQVNLLEANSGMIQVGAIPVPFSFIIGASLLFFILGTIGINNRKAAKKYAMRGVRLLIPILLIILAIIFLKFIAYQASGMEGAEDIKEIMESIASRPITGKEMLILPEYGNVYVNWGMREGAILLLLAAILLIVSGLIKLMTKEKE